jgi:hypothetical protein
MIATSKNQTLSPGVDITQRNTRRRIVLTATIFSIAWTYTLTLEWCLYLLISNRTPDSFILMRFAEPPLALFGLGWLIGIASVAVGKCRHVKGAQPSSIRQSLCLGAAIGSAHVIWAMFGWTGEGLVPALFGGVAGVAAVYVCMPAICRWNRFSILDHYGRLYGFVALFLMVRIVLVLGFGPPWNNDIYFAFLPVETKQVSVSPRGGLRAVHGYCGDSLYSNSDLAIIEPRYSFGGIFSEVVAWGGKDSVSDIKWPGDHSVTVEHADYSELKHYGGVEIRTTFRLIRTPTTARAYPSALPTLHR